MRPTIILVLTMFVLVQPMAMAQQAGENINVLPVVFPQDDADWFIKGDGYLQRQVEPSIAASTRNPDHLVAFFNDYRAVDVGDDIGLGETENMVALVNTARTIMMAASWLPLPELHLQPAAAAEAWVGMSRSYDGGLTWSGGFLPGAPFDIGSQATLDAPVFGLEAATDPVVAPGPCGKFYVVFMAFTRGNESKLVVARYQDLNNLEGGDSIVYQGMTVVESGNNATNGYFLDKPDIEVDVFRDSNPDICADRVYVSYSTFNGLDNDGKFQSKVSFARSFDGGLTFDAQKLNPPYKQNQGSALAVDPSNGDIHMIWRHFWAPDAILMVTSINYGKKWSKPVVVTSDVPMAAFDQPTISTLMAPLSTGPNPGFPEVAFRSNGFPTAAVNDSGTLFVAWQERVDLAAGDNRGRPLEGGSPRIVVVHTNDDGRSWFDVDGIPDNRRAVDMGDRDNPNDPNLPAPGFGALPQYRPSGPQVMPKLSFSGDRLLLAYYESRGRIAGYGTGSETIVPDPHVSFDTGFISGYDRLIDLRTAVLDRGTGAMISTAQVSRYPIRAGANLLDGEDLSDVAAVNSPCFPDSADTNDPFCVRQVNRVNAPQSAAGTSPFIGDYIDLAPSVQFVFDDGAWRWATGANDVPYQGGHTVFADNRHLIPPTEVPFGEDPNQDEWDLYRYYSPPGTNILCINGGSRNTDVLTAKVEAELVVSAPTTFKQLDNRRGFPLSISNRTATPRSRSYHVSIIEGGDFASFGLYDPTVDGGDVEIFANSSTSLMVYVDANAAGRVRVGVTENGCGVDCSTGTATFILDPNNPALPALNGPDEQYPEVTDPFVINPFVINGAETPFVINPFVINPFVINPFVINPFVINPFVINPFVINPFVINPSVPDYIENVVDTTWTVKAGGSNTASSYLPLINIDNAQAYLDAGYAFQLIAYKGSLYGGLSDCDPVNIAQPQILSNVAQDPHDTAHNPFVINPFVINPFVINPFVINDGIQNPFVINSTFTIAPSDDVIEDGTTKAPPASNDVKVTLRAFKLKTDTNLKNGIIYDPEQDPPSLVIVPLPCDPENPINCDVFSLAPDLAPIGVDTTPVIADADGILAGFPDGGWDLDNQGYGNATAENGILRHGFYICDIEFVDSFDTLPRTAPLEINDPLCTFADFLPSASNTLAPQASEVFVAADLSIPNMTEGDYYLVLYVDDTVEVSERNEVNNWVKIPITIEEPNEPPVVTDLAFDTDEDTILSESLYVTDPDDDPLTFELTTDSSSGSVVITGNAFTYTPDLNFNGEDSFVFEVDDGEYTASATVSITVNPINDPPTVDDLSLTVDEDLEIQGIVVASDVDGDNLSYVFNPAPTLGTATDVDAVTGAFTYTPNLNANGTDSFGIQVGDGFATTAAAVTVTINPVNDAPVAADVLLTTDEDTPATVAFSATDVEDDNLTYIVVVQPTHGAVSEDPIGTFTYTPTADYNGSDSFTYKANDGGLDSNTATVFVTVTPTNDPPIAVDAAFDAFENTPLTGTLVGYDIDIDDNLDFSVGTGPVSGIAVVDPATGAFTYTPGPSFIGLDTFTFVVTDTSDASATGIVTINVIDPVPNWNFIGFATPWRPGYKVKAGSAIPLKWYYTDPNTGDIVPSYHEDLDITATGYPTCNPVGDPIAVLDLPEDAGSSDLRYNDGNWQLNWDTSGLQKGCYYLEIYHPTTNQIDDTSDGGAPLTVHLK